MVYLTTVVAPSPNYAEAVVSYLGYEFESDGLTISSVQNDSYGDGRAFKGEATARDVLDIVHMFRVRNLIAAVNYVGSAAAGGDVETQAVNVARKQEAKFFNVFAQPPTPTPVPTTVPTATPTPTPTATPTPTPSVRPSRTSDRRPLSERPHLELCGLQSVMRTRPVVGRVE